MTIPELAPEGCAGASAQTADALKCYGIAAAALRHDKRVRQAEYGARIRRSVVWRAQPARELAVTRVREQDHAAITPVTYHRGSKVAGYICSTDGAAEAPEADWSRGDKYEEKLDRP